jgi:hypothetical protein
MQHKTDKITFLMSTGEFGVAAIGLLVVFGFYWKQIKPTFVKVIWAFITLGILTAITQVVLSVKWDKLNYTGILFYWSNIYF